MPSDTELSIRQLGKIRKGANNPLRLILINPLGRIWQCLSLILLPTSSNALERLISDGEGIHKSMQGSFPTRTTTLAAHLERPNLDLCRL